MNRWFRILSFLLLLSGGRTFLLAQNEATWQEYLDAVSDDEYAENSSWTEHMEEAELLHAHPLDINTATRDQLRQIPFLTDEQIEDIHTYIFLHRGLRSMGELMAIPSLDYRARHFLPLFLYAGNQVFEYKDTLTLKSLLKASKHELVTRLNIPLYYRAGYSYPPSEGGYKGSTLYNRIRYQMKSKNHLDFGLSAEKDQGEPFRGNRGWDKYGFYLNVRNFGILRSVVLGDFKMGFGEGVAINTGFSTGKTYFMNRPSQGIRASRGSDEYNYFRGGAVTFGVGEVNLTAFISHRLLDASLNKDGTARTLITDGYHRTLTELDRKHNLGSTLTGGNLTWKHKGMRLGTTGYFQRFHRDLSPGDALYRAIYPKGRNFGVVSMDYGYRHPFFDISGETAYSTEKGGWATLNRLSWKITPNYTLSGSYRFYSLKYYSFYASALSENSNVQNESGATLRLDANPFGQMTLTAYADFFYNPWPRYTMTHSSSGQEFSFTTEYPWHRNNKIGVRYQLKRKERNDVMETHHRIRLQYTREQGEHWNLQSMLNLHILNGTGFSLSQRVRYVLKPTIQASAMLSYFRTPNYGTRLYVYEPLLTEMFRFPSFYGKGFRLVMAGRYSFWNQRLTIEFLYGMTRYTDRETQGSDMQEIRSPWKNDLSVQLKIRI